MFLCLLLARAPRRGMPQPGDIAIHSTGPAQMKEMLATNHTLIGISGRRAAKVLHLDTEQTTLDAAGTLDG